MNLFKFNNFNKNKRALGKDFFIGLLIMVIVAWVAISIFLPRIAGTNVVSGNFLDPTKVDACQYTVNQNLGDNYDPKELDFDEDGIYDNCDICVVKVSRDFFEENKKYFHPDLATRGYRLSKNDDHDDDGDGVPNACDSDPDKPSTNMLGFKSNSIQRECKRIGAMYNHKDSHFVEVKVREQSDDYKMCWIEEIS